MQTLTASAANHYPVDADASSEEFDAALERAMEEGIAETATAANLEMEGLLAAHTAAGGLAIVSESETNAKISATDDGIDVTVEIVMPVTAARGTAA